MNDSPDVAFSELVEIMSVSEGPGAAATAAISNPRAEALALDRARTAMTSLDRWGESIAELETLAFWGRAIAFESTHRLGPAFFGSERQGVLLQMDILVQQTFEEVITLLRSNHPVGALARWRRLFEFSILISLLSAGDDDLASSFMEHEGLRRDREFVRKYRISKEFGYERDPREFVRSAQSRVDAVYADRGRDFGLDYAWAHGPAMTHNPRYAKAFAAGRRRSPNLIDLAEVVGLEQMASEYAEASAAVHASTELDGLVSGDRALTMAAHNTCYAISVSCGKRALSEPSVVDETLDDAVDVLIAMSHQVASRFEPKGPEDPE